MAPSQVLKPGAALVIEGEGMPHKEERWRPAGTTRGDPWLRMGNVAVGSAARVKRDD